MASYYTVALTKTTGAEITGGRVGHFTLVCTDSFYLGDSGVSSSDLLVPGGAGVAQTLYVTSPDDVYAITQNDNTGTMKIFHNR